MAEKLIWMLRGGPVRRLPEGPRAALPGPLVVRAGGVTPEEARWLAQFALQLLH